jgi:hypothetical protein
MLLWHYRRQPEDNRIHYMLGYCALLRGDFEFADQRLTYAYELFNGADLAALAVAAAARAFKGDEQGAKAALEALRDAPVRPPAPNFPPDNVGNRVAPLFSPFVWEPRLSQLPAANDLLRILNEVFPEGPGEELAPGTQTGTPGSGTA